MRVRSAAIVGTSFHAPPDGTWVHKRLVGSLFAGHIITISAVTWPFAGVIYIE